MAPARLFCFALALSLALSTASAAAQTSPRSSSQRELRAALPGQLLLSSLSTLAVSAGTFYLAYEVTDDDGRGALLSSTTITLLTGLPLAPSIAAGTAQGVGRHFGVDGSYWRAWGFSLLGTAAFGGAGLWLGASVGDPRYALGLSFSTLALASLGGALGAAYGYDSRASPRFERVARRLSPKVSTTADQRGALFSVSGTF